MDAIVLLREVELLKSKRTTRDQSPRPPTDELAAMAFAAEALEKAHADLPKDFRRYVSPASLRRDADRHYIVSFGWQRKTSRTGAEKFFEALVNPWNAKTTVLLDTPLDDWQAEDFEVYA